MEIIRSATALGPRTFRCDPRSINWLVSRLHRFLHRTRQLRKLRSLPEESDKLHSTKDAKDLILAVLRSTATKREARQYISRYTPLIGGVDLAKRTQFVNTLLRDSRFDHDDDPFEPAHKSTFNSGRPLRVAIIKIRDLKSIDPTTVMQLGSTITRLSKLGVSPVVVIDAGKERNDYLNLDNQPFRHYRRAITWKAAAVANAIESSNSSICARPVEGLFDWSPSSGLSFSLPQLVLLPLSNGVIPVVVPLAYDVQNSQEVLVSADDAVVYLSQQLNEAAAKNNMLTVDKLIFIDPLGGIPSVERSQGAHVYVNLTQELSDISAELHIGFITPTARSIHLANLRTMDRALSVLPSSATGLITTPAVAASNSTRNPIIYNILTDRPVISPSLPVELKKTPMLETTVVRKGMPVKMLRSSSGIDLKQAGQDGTIDLERLWHLIEDSFGRKLDVDHYMARINGRVAGIIIAGDYEGAAIITWEQSGQSKTDGSDNEVVKTLAEEKPLSELDRILAHSSSPRTSSTPSPSLSGARVAYLDKFAVLRSSQGASGVADVVFKAMVMSLFPDELLWRSRASNPVNKWYFERSKGTLKLPGTHWCMFWTGTSTKEDSHIQDYIDICSTIEPSWLN